MESQFLAARNLKKKGLEDRKQEFVRIRDYADVEIGKIEAQIKVIEYEDSEEVEAMERISRGKRAQFLQERGADLTIDDINEFFSWTYDELHALYVQFKPKHASETFASSPHRTDASRISDIRHFLHLHSCKKCGKLAHHTGDHPTQKPAVEAPASCKCRLTLFISNSRLNHMTTLDLNDPKLTCSDFFYLFDTLHSGVDSSHITSPHSSCVYTINALKKALLERACTRCNILSHSTAKHLKFVIDDSGAHITKACFTTYFDEWTIGDLMSIYSANNGLSSVFSQLITGKEVDIEKLRNFVLSSWPERSRNDLNNTSLQLPSRTISISKPAGDKLAKGISIYKSMTSEEMAKLVEFCEKGTGGAAKQTLPDEKIA